MVLPSTTFEEAISKPTISSIFSPCYFYNSSCLFVEVKGRSDNILTQHIDLPQGTLDLLILRTVALGPQHGWAISERVQQMSATRCASSRVRSIPPSTGSSGAA